MDDWLPERPYLRIDNVTGLRRGSCGNCGWICGWKNVESCPVCKVVFTEITSPYDHERAFCEEMRPDLEYVSLQWG